MMRVRYSYDSFHGRVVTGDKWISLDTPLHQIRDGCVNCGLEMEILEVRP